MNERAHVEYFDWLRIIAALSVIFMHTAAGPLRAGINTGWHLLNVCTSLAFTAVPLFFMMSGYLLMTSRKTADISVLLRHRLPRLVVPLAGWTVVAVLWQLFLAHTLTPGAIRAQLVAALNGPVMVHFWYLYTLIALYVLSPILYGGIRTLGKSGRVYLFVLAACIFLLCKQTCNRPPRAWVRAALGSVVSLSMAIYLMHNIFLSTLYSVGVSPRSFGGTVGVTLLVFAACFAVTKTVATVKPLCYLATGKTYAEACRSCNWVYTFRRLRGHTETKT